MLIHECSLGVGFAMKPKKKQDKKLQRALFSAIASLEDVKEVELFLHDLCTPAELEAMVDRWTVVGPILDGQSYRSIYADTGVSLTTIGRVARVLRYGDNGYRRVFELVNKKSG